jgi:CubicO group peptidase (beta-lactamase class C family)
MRWPFLASFLLVGCASNPALPKAAAPPLAVEEPLASAPTPPPSHQRVVDELASTWVQAGKAKGIAVGLLSRGTTEVYGYGQAADGDGARPPDGNTVFEIGSVTKVFTAVLLAQMAERKLVAIEEPLRELLPGGVKCAFFTSLPTPPAFRVCPTT